MNWKFWKKETRKIIGFRYKKNGITKVPVYEDE